MTYAQQAKKTLMHALQKIPASDHLCFIWLNIFPSDSEISYWKKCLGLFHFKLS